MSLFCLPVAIFNKLTERAFNPLESTLLDTARKNLPPEVSRILDAQLREINFVRRHHYKRYTQTFFYRVGLFTVGLSGRNLMEFPTEMTRFAAIDFSVGRSKVRAQLSALDGEFFVIEYRRNVKAFEHSSEISVAGFDGEPVPLELGRHRAKPISAKKNPKKPPHDP